MIQLQHISKTYHVRGCHKVVANNISVAFPTRSSVALLGRNGAGKSSLLRIIAGTMNPDSGRVNVKGSISWPVGFAGSFAPDLSGAQNTMFVARVYGVDTDELLESVAEFSELGEQFKLPVRTYSSGMKSRLAFGISLGIGFDNYLVDEVTAVGDIAFRKKSAAIFKERLVTSGAVIISHSMSLIRDLCDHGAVLENGNLYYFDAVEDAIKFHEASVKSAANLK